MTQTAFDRFLAPARRRPALWRMALGVTAATAVFTLCTAALFAFVARVGGTGSGSPLRGLMRPDTPAAVLVLFASFLGMMLAAWTAAALHRRGPLTLIGPDPRRAAADFLRAAATVGIVYAPALALWAMAFDSAPGLEVARWLTLLPLTLLGLLVQTGAEEMLFRGYLTQQLAARFRSPLIWAALPALLFGLLHADPGRGVAMSALTVLSAALFGLIATDLVVRTGSLGAAWGFHFANNVAAIALLSTEGTITGLALRRTPYAADDPAVMIPLMLGDLAIMVLAWAVLLRGLGQRRRAA